MPYSEVVGILTDIGTEDLAHQEIVSAIIHQLIRNLTPEREIVHVQRFGDGMRIVQDAFDYKNFYAYNPAFDKK